MADEQPSFMSGLPRGTKAMVDIRCTPSSSLAPLLDRLQVAVILSAPHSGNVILVSAPDGQLAISFHTFQRAMGLAVSAEAVAVCSHTEVWFLRNAPDIAAKIEPRGRHDAAYLARATHFTGDIQAHEAAWIRGELWLVNTLFSCLCTLHERYSFTPRWRPPFITDLVPEDRCHLNGLALRDGLPAYVTAISETNSAQGWRAHKATGGCLIEIAGGRVVARGLCMPHSPRLVQGRVYLADSGTGRLVAIDPADGRAETVANLPAFTRGLAIHGSTAFVGLSRIRPTSDLTGLPITAHPERLQCGLAVVDLTTGQTVAHLFISSPVDEIFDVQLLAGIRSPILWGPHADREQGHPLWTVPPRQSAI
jgi:uncharacterized protein (TIGR03032 family)